MSEGEEEGRRLKWAVDRAMMGDTVERTEVDGGCWSVAACLQVFRTVRVGVIRIEPISKRLQRTTYSAVAGGRVRATEIIEACCRQLRCSSAHVQGSAHRSNESENRACLQEASVDYVQCSDRRQIACYGEREGSWKLTPVFWAEGEGGK